MEDLPILIPTFISVKEFQNQVPRISCTKFDSPWGEWMIGMAGEYLCFFSFLGKDLMHQRYQKMQDRYKGIELKIEGKNKQIDVIQKIQSMKKVKCLLRGTAFQHKVWEELISLTPQKKLVTYKELANSIGHPKACRAVANAVGSNPICWLIPCHRVVASNGIGGYGLGLRLKRELLLLEGLLQHIEG
mmetsp:Transcript_35038/g.44671  ORF Transcript_35038/g.44671 Transcript_35038/m.44671 type:complete len:188 (-) Transcript_35038:308-871(-)